MVIDQTSLFNNLLKLSSDSIFVLNTDGKLQTANNNLIELLKFSKLELESLNYENLFVNISDYRSIKNTIKLSNSLDKFHTTIKTKENIEIQILLSIKKLTNDDVDRRYIGAIEVQNRLGYIDEEIDLKQRMALLSVFAKGLTVDFNNLLMGIGGNLSMVLMDAAKMDPKHVQYLKKGQNVVYQASNLVKQFQTLSTEPTGKNTSIDFYLVANNSFSLLKKATSHLIEKRVEFNQNQFYVLGDRIKLNQVILHLATNSINSIETKGAQKGDFIAINASKATNDELVSRNIEENEYIHITFEDSGTGMSDEVLKKIFHPFFTTKEKTKIGKGLSLSVVYDIITRQSNGFINVESILNQGTKFHIFLPVGHSEVKIKEYEVYIPSVPATETVLIVDDEPSVLNVLEESLLDIGHKVITAVDGEDCIEKYLECKDQIDIIILDLNMPKMNGKQTFKKLLEIDPSVKVIISSGYNEEEIRRGILSNAKGFLSKPYEISKMGSIIRELFKR